MTLPPSCHPVVASSNSSSHVQLRESRGRITPGRRPRSHRIRHMVGRSGTCRMSGTLRRRPRSHRIRHMAGRSGTCRTSRRCRRRTRIRRRAGTPRKGRNHRTPRKGHRPCTHRTRSTLPLVWSSAATTIAPRTRRPRATLGLLLGRCASSALRPDVGDLRLQPSLTPFALE